MKIPDNKRITIDTQADTNKGFKVTAILCGAVLVAAITVFVSIYNTNKALEAGSSQAQLETTTVSENQISYSIPPIETTTAKSTVPYETTTSVSVQPDGTTVYIQTNTPPLEGKYATSEEAAAAHQPSDEIIETYLVGQTPKTTTPADTVIVTTAPPQTKAPAVTVATPAPGLPSNPVSGNNYTASDGTEWNYNPKVNNIIAGSPWLKHDTSGNKTLNNGWDGNPGEVVSNAN